MRTWQLRSCKGGSAGSEGGALAEHGAGQRDGRSPDEGVRLQRDGCNDAALAVDRVRAHQVGHVTHVHPAKHNSMFQKNSHLCLAPAPAVLFWLVERNIWKASIMKPSVEITSARWAACCLNIGAS